MSSLLDTSSRVCVRSHACAYAHVRIRVCMCVCVCARLHACVRVCAYMCACMCVCACALAFVRTHSLERVHYTDSFLNSNSFQISLLAKNKIVKMLIINRLRRGYFFCRLYQKITYYHLHNSHKF